jgi:hypothetical protein
MASLVVFFAKVNACPKPHSIFGNQESPEKKSCQRNAFKINSIYNQYGQKNLLFYSKLMLYSEKQTCQLKNSFFPKRVKSGP